MDVETLILGGSYVSIFLFMVTNGLLTLPSSQLLYIIVGYMVSTGTLALIPALLIGALGNMIGNIILYELVRARGMYYINQFRLFREEDIKRVEIVFRKRGLWFLFIGKLLPAIKVFIPIPAALGRVHRGVFAILMFASSTIWASIFIGLGFVFGKSAHLWKSYSAILFVVALCILFIFYRLLNHPSVTEEILKEGGRGAKHT
jgi:membrane protein DedA with SNARE-associated domain